MKAHNVDYVKSSYSEGIHFMLDEMTDLSLKHSFRSLKLKGERHQRIQKSLALLSKVLKKWSSRFKRDAFLKPVYKAPEITQ